MNLRLTDLNLEVALNKTITFITIEEPEQYYKCILELNKAFHGENSNFALVEEDKFLDCNKSAVLIIDPVEFSVEDSAYKKALIKEIQGYFEQIESDQELVEINQAFSRIIDNIALGLPFDLEYEDSAGLKDILSLYKVRIKPVDGNFLERLVEYINIVHRLTFKKIYIIVNCCDLMTEYYYKEFEKFCKYEDISVVFVNEHQFKTEVDINDIIIDSDYCEI